ncbi:MAG: hypothetical protein IJ996_01950 [Clostridia bacterium]|nr:hypothetical protein [Clostridia bacterium]
MAEALAAAVAVQDNALINVNTVSAVRICGRLLLYLGIRQIKYRPLAFANGRFPL